MTIEEKATFCRICEAACGLIGTVEDGKLLSLRPDKDHPLSKGFACPKGIAYTELQNDPERVLYPMKRQADGSFTRVSWDDAMSDIASRLAVVKQRHGGAGVGWYVGNPTVGNYSHLLWALGLAQALGAHIFSTASQDTNSRFVASHLLYGFLTTVPIPDLDAADTAVILGANPAVSHGSMVSIPRFIDKLDAVVERGGRVFVIDPRRTETARLFEWVPVTPDSDAWMLLSMLYVLFEEGLADPRSLAVSTGHRELRRAAADRKSVV